MNWKKESKILFWIVAVFLGCYFLPIGQSRFNQSVLEALYLVKWYAREHVLLCLVPAFFIAGAIAVFVSKASVVKYFGEQANKFLSYSVASISGTILAVCSCTVLPLFAGIYNKGAGIGPAIAFLYSGPAINALAIILTARILGLKIGIARAVGAVLFSVVIGLIMQLLFKKDKLENVDEKLDFNSKETKRTLWQNMLYFLTMVGILVFANWAKPTTQEGIWYSIFSIKWIITGVFAAGLSIILCAWFGLKIWKVIAVALPTLILALLFPQTPLIAFAAGTIGLSTITSTDKGETKDWFESSWGFAKQILPLLLFGVLIAGALLGRPDQEGLIPSEWVTRAVGGNSIRANLFASVAGAFMYFATLTEVPILQGLIGSGMGEGPALALLLAGPALSLPNMLVIRSVLGTKKTVVFVLLVIVMATLSGILFGALF